MQELNKFQIFTIIFLLMFIFVVGAIYSNTRDAVENKAKETNNIQNSDNDYYKYQQNLSPAENEKFRNLSQRVGILEERFAVTENESKAVTGIKCRIQGVMDGDDVIPLSQGDALKEAQYNKKEIVMLCAF